MFCHEVFVMKKKIIFELLLYISLLAGCLLFVGQSINEYLSGFTSYSVTHAPILMTDLPTVTFCIESAWLFAPEEWVYGSHFTVGVRLSNKKNKYSAKGFNTLVEDEFVETLVGHNMSLTRFYQTSHREQQHLDEMLIWQCYKISIKATKKNEEVVSPDFKVNFYFHMMDFGGKSWRYWFQTLQQIHVWVTSDSNSYGLVNQRWFDGFISSPSLSIKLNSDGCNNYNKTNCQFRTRIQIVEITEFYNLDSPCSKDSYYECLAKRFRKLEFNKVNHAIDGINCTFTKLCTPFSLPFGEENVSMCLKNGERLCYNLAIQKLEEDQDVYCKKSCHMKEFKTELGPEIDGFPKRLFVFSYQFTMPSSSRNLRSMKLFKIVKTEYLVYSLMSLVGSIGGTLGMFVGFSFISSSEWLIKMIEQYLNSFKMWLNIRQDYESSDTHQTNAVIMENKNPSFKL